MCSLDRSAIVRGRTSGFVVVQNSTKCAIRTTCTQSKTDNARVVLRSASVYALVENLPTFHWNGRATTIPLENHDGVTYPIVFKDLDRQEGKKNHPRTFRNAGELNSKDRRTTSKLPVQRGLSPRPSTASSTGHHQATCRLKQLKTIWGITHNKSV
ncbi:hypothetical protein AVEN_100716-1 [Araneus ventricosus]|uniref:Uncharacterized protein n=1 Tax=Araneus ventricosus TaxID=182803 RepID=A0A4Y2CUP2_ARAVE|nr:hypothetical protein AVEN_100716-1 [Araneus ventricosus]